MSECPNTPQRDCPLSSGGLLQIRELIVQPITQAMHERIDALEARLVAKQTEQGKVLEEIRAKQADHEARLSRLERMVKLAIAIITAGVSGIQLAVNAWGGWVRQKLGF